MEDREGVGDRAAYGDCDIIEAQFPHISKCFMTRAGTFVPEYDSVCPYCSAMTFPPNSLSLEIVTIFECSRLGYIRRTSDAKLMGSDGGPEIPGK